MTTNRTQRISSILIALPAVAGVALLSSSVLAGTKPGNTVSNGCERSLSNGENWCMLGAAGAGASMAGSSSVAGNGWNIGVNPGYSGSLTMRCTNNNQVAQVFWNGGSYTLGEAGYGGLVLGQGNYQYVCTSGGSPIEAFCSGNGGTCNNR